MKIKGIGILSQELHLGYFNGLGDRKNVETGVSGINVEGQR